MADAYIVVWCSRSARVYQRGFGSFDEALAHFNKMNSGERKHIWVYLTKVVQQGGTGYVK